MEWDDQKGLKRAKPIELKTPVGICHDLGRAAALQKLEDYDNPYSSRREQEQCKAWLEGIHS